MELEAYMEMPEDELKARIARAKKEKNAVILAHNYQRLEVQEIADHLGDSLGLSIVASKTDADVVVFCGVNFMAESAKILSPEKTVLLPEIKANCPMADMVDPEALMAVKLEHPERKIVAYVNTTAEVKALVDVCCTSANALNVIRHLEGEDILFVPDKNLGHYINVTTGSRMHLWDGYCYVHNFFTVKDVERAREAHPEAVLLVHPESPPEVVALADHALSTSGMVKYVNGIETEEERRNGVIIGTETGLVGQIIEMHTGTGIWPLSEFAVCGTMKMTTLPKVCWSLETGRYEIIIPGDIMDKARSSLEKMISIA